MKRRKVFGLFLTLCIVMSSVLSGVGVTEVYAEANVFNGNLEQAKSALDSFLDLEANTTLDCLKGALTMLQENIREDMQDDNSISDAIAYLEEGNRPEEFATYLLDWIYTWRVDPAYKEELEGEDLNSEEGVDHAYECIIDRMRDLCYRYDMLTGRMTGNFDFLGYCKAALPKASDEGGLDYAHEVTDDELRGINRYVTGILEIYGGEEFVIQWSQREENEGCSYPVSADGTDIEFTKENVQLMLSKIVKCAYFKEESGDKVCIWNNWNYMHDIMEQGSVSIKENDDLTHFILEAIGDGARKYAKPVTVIKKNETGSQNFTDLKTALASVNDEEADYEIYVSSLKADSLTNEDFNTSYKSLKINLCDKAELQTLNYSGEELNLHGDVSIQGGSIAFNSGSGVDVTLNKEGKAVFSLDVTSGSGNISYDKSKIKVILNHEVWNGTIDNGD